MVSELDGAFGSWVGVSLQIFSIGERRLESADRRDVGVLLSRPHTLATDGLVSRNRCRCEYSLEKGIAQRKSHIFIAQFVTSPTHGCFRIGSCKCLASIDATIVLPDVEVGFHLEPSHELPVRETEWKGESRRWRDLPQLVPRFVVGNEIDAPMHSSQHGRSPISVLALVRQKT